MKVFLKNGLKLVFLACLVSHCVCEEEKQQEKFPLLRGIGRALLQATNEDERLLHSVPTPPLPTPPEPTPPLPTPPEPTPPLPTPPLPTPSFKIPTKALVLPTKTIVTPTKAIVIPTRAIPTQPLVLPTPPKLTPTGLVPTPSIKVPTPPIPTKAIVSPTQPLVLPTDPFVSPVNPLVFPTLPEPTPPEPTPPEPTPPEPTPPLPTPPLPTPPAPHAPHPTPTPPTPTAPSGGGGGGGGGGSGNPGGHPDPHFRTWKGLLYDYHGQCDLIYTTCPSFDNNKGLHIHIRTKFVMPLQWSTITSLAIKIGDDTFEIQDDGTYYLNRNVNPALLDTTNIAGYKIQHVIKPNRSKFTISLGDGISLELNRYIRLGRNSIHFQITGAHDHRDNGGTSLLDCVGLTSTWDHPEDDMFLVGRTGTIYSPSNTIDFGPEWQVDRTKGDPMLFAEDIGQQLPDQRCLDSHFDVEDKRHLNALYTSEGGSLARQAEDACSHLNGGNKDLIDACVFDVLVTGDVSFAEEPWYNGGDEF